MASAETIDMPQTLDSEEEEEERATTPPLTENNIHSDIHSYSGSRKVKFQPTVPKPFKLGIDQRIAERQRFDEGRKKRQKAAEERERVLNEQKKKEEEREIKAYRKSLEFKATPVRKYRGITIMPSDREPTYPIGPELVSGSRPRSTSAGSSLHEESYSPEHEP